jgi:hypothetical protein
MVKALSLSLSLLNGLSSYRGVGRYKWRAFVVSWRGSLQVAGFRRVVAWVAAGGGSFRVSMAWVAANGGPARVRGVSR